MIIITEEIDWKIVIITSNRDERVEEAYSVRRLKDLFTLTHAGYRKYRLGSSYDQRILCGQCKLNGSCKIRYSFHCGVCRKFDAYLSYKYFHIIFIDIKYNKKNEI